MFSDVVHMADPALTGVCLFDLSTAGRPDISHGKVSLNHVNVSAP